MAREAASTRGILEPNAARSHFELTRRAPAADLAGHVERHWIVRWSLPPGAEFVQEILPHPCVNLVSGASGIAAHGIPRRRSSHRLEGSGFAAGTKFRPGGFVGFLGAPAGALGDRALGLADAFHEPGARLEHELVDAGDSFPRYIRAVEAFLRERLPAPDRRYALVRAAVEDMLTAGPSTTVAELAERQAVSQRTLQRAFRHYVGAGQSGSSGAIGSTRRPSGSPRARSKAAPRSRASSATSTRRTSAKTSARRWVARLVPTRGPAPAQSEMRGRRLRAAAGSAAFFAAAPGVVAGVVPWLLTDWRMADVPSWWTPLRPAGAALVLAGAAVLVHAFARFVSEGIGTPAPLAPTERLVVGGWYRYVRNPMYLAVAAAILGQALLLGSLALLAYLMIFGAAVFAFVRLYEEPALRRRFGGDYEDYLRAVPGWRPRRRPWTPPPA